ncbi:MAG: fumarate hydratase [Klebsiella michiganensis]|nr:fumarate hydratase [Klebsiella michiganensis]
MSNKPFVYQDPFPLKKDDTEYYLLSSDYVSVAEFAGQEVLKVEPQALTLLAQHAFHDASFMLRPAHQQQVADILNDPEASENDKYVALQFLRNSDIAAKGVLPTCQDTGTAIITGKKGQRVWTGGGDEAALAQGVYNTYIQDNLRYSQNAPLDMYREVNTGTNLPAQIDLYATDGEEYKFLCIAKGGGSANKTYLYQETKALITPAKLKNYLVEKMRTLGTAACPPYHIAFVIGGTSAESTLKTVKLASTKYYDGLPTEGNEHGQAFRDIQLEQELLVEAQNLGLGAQFGGKYFAHDIRVKVNLNQPMSDILALLSQYPVSTRLSLSGTIIVARDIAHAKLKELIDSGEALPQYVKDHPIYYAGPAKTPDGYASGSLGPTTAGRMDSYVDLLQAHGASKIMLAKGNRSQQVTDACHKHGGFYLGSIGGPAAVLAQQSIRSLECVAYPELGMEAIWKIEVEDFPAFILVDDKGNDFFQQIQSSQCARCVK